MDPKVKEFLVFSTALLFALAIYMLYRPKRPPSRLSMRSGNKGGVPPAGKSAHMPPKKEGFEEGPTPDSAVELSVIFQFNGHSFEAYEVLGLPAGSGKDKVHQAYQAAIENADPEGREFVQFAYQAILKKFK